MVYFLGYHKEKNMELKHCHKRTCLKYISLLVGCLSMLTGGSIAAINAYSSDLRDTFNMTQSEGMLCVPYEKGSFPTLTVAVWVDQWDEK